MIIVTITEKNIPRHLTFDRQEVLVGRVQANDVVLFKGNVSRHHCKIIEKNGVLFVVDLKSSGGTYVNNQLVRDPVALQPDDKILIGDLVLQASYETGTLQETTMQFGALPSVNQKGRRRLHPGLAEDWVGCFAKRMRLYLLGHSGTIYCSEDRGETLIPIYKSPQTLWSIQGDNSGNLCTVGDGGHIALSSDRGESWRSFSFDTDLSALYFGERGLRCVVGEGGEILRSADSGQSWQRVQSPTQASLYSICANPAEHLVAVGHGGVILYSQDKGLSWQISKTHTQENLLDVCYTGASFVAVGTGGVTLHSANGLDWTVVLSQYGAENLWSVAAHPKRGVRAAGKNGTLLAAKNNFTGWQKEDSGLQEWLSCICCDELGVFFCAGGKATLLID